MIMQIFFIKFIFENPFLQKRKYLDQTFLTQIFDFNADFQKLMNFQVTYEHFRFLDRSEVGFKLKYSVAYFTEQNFRRLIRNYMLIKQLIAYIDTFNI